MITAIIKMKSWGGFKSGFSGDRSHLARFSIGALCLLLSIVVICSLVSGASDASFFEAMASLVWTSNKDALSARDAIIIFDIRLPRTLLGALIGAALAVSGALMQGLFRNPLADPGIVGVSSGAGLGATAVIVMGNAYFPAFLGSWNIFALPLAAFGGGLVSTFLLYGVSTRRGRTSVATMLLAGIALAALTGAATGLFIFIADDRQLRDLTFWGLGSLAGATWDKLIAAGPLIALALIAAPFLANGLNKLALGEASAYYMGLKVQRFKNQAIFAVAAATGASVAVSGGIGFIGIVAPHLLRLAIGPDHKFLLPASALLGASLLLIADAIARVVVAPAELPIGIVTAIIGGPFFLWILLRNRNVIDL